MTDDITHDIDGRTEGTIGETSSFWLALYDALHPSSYLRTRTKVLIVGALVLGVVATDIVFAAILHVLTGVAGIDAAVAVVAVNVLSVAYTVYKN